MHGHNTKKYIHTCHTSRTKTFCSRFGAECSSSLLLDNFDSLACEWPHPERSLPFSPGWPPALWMTCTFCFLAFHPFPCHSLCNNKKSPLPLCVLNPPCPFMTFQSFFSLSIFPPLFSLTLPDKGRLPSSSSSAFASGTIYIVAWELGPPPTPLLWNASLLLFHEERTMVPTRVQWGERWGNVDRAGRGKGVREVPLSLINPAYVCIRAIYLCLCTIFVCRKHSTSV